MLGQVHPLMCTLRLPPSLHLRWLWYWKMNRGLPGQPGEITGEMEGWGGSDILWHLKCISVSHSHFLSMCQCVSLVLHKKGRDSLFLQLFLILQIDEGGRSKRCSAAGNMQPPFLSLCSSSHSFHSVFSPCVTSSSPQWVSVSPSTSSLFPHPLSFALPPSSPSLSGVLSVVTALCFAVRETAS